MAGTEPLKSLLHSKLNEFSSLTRSARELRDLCSERLFLGNCSKSFTVTGHPELWGQGVQPQWAWLVTHRRRYQRYPSPTHLLNLGCALGHEYIIVH